MMPEGLTPLPCPTQLGARIVKSPAWSALPSPVSSGQFCGSQGGTASLPTCPGTSPSPPAPTPPTWASPASPASPTPSAAGMIPTAAPVTPTVISHSSPPPAMEYYDHQHEADFTD